MVGGGVQDAGEVRGIWIPRVPLQSPLVTPLTYLCICLFVYSVTISQCLTICVFSAGHFNLYCLSSSPPSLQAFYRLLQHWKAFDRSRLPPAFPSPPSTPPSPFPGPPPPCCCLTRSLLASFPLRRLSVSSSLSSSFYPPSLILLLFILLFPILLIRLSPSPLFFHSSCVVILGVFSRMYGREH